MQLKLRALFILVAIAAVISAWFAQRAKPLPFGAMVQIVNPVPGNPSTNERNIDFENAFYLLVTQKLAAEHPETLTGISDAKAQLPELIRCELIPTEGNTPIYSVNVWGTAFSDRKRLETMMKTAVEALVILSKDNTRSFATKILMSSSP